MKSTGVILLVVTMMCLSGCGKSSDQQKMEEAAKKMEDAAKKIGDGAQGGAENFADAMKQMSEALNDGKKVEPVNFRDLKALLPESLEGLTRSDASGERTSAMGIDVAEAHAEYSADDGKNIRVKITDFGSMSGAVRMATFGWTMAQIDRESDNEYERTTTWNGHKAFERYNSEGKHGSVQVLVANRFVVEVEGNDVAMSAIKGALSKVDVGKLESMKGAGVTG